MAFDFTGKRVWVTGAGRGIGREVATQFVAAGAARLLPQSALTGERLAQEVRAMAGRDTLLAMAEAARRASFGDVSTVIARTCQELSHEK